MPSCTSKTASGTTCSFHTHGRFSRFGKPQTPGSPKSPEKIVVQQNGGSKKMWVSTLTTPGLRIQDAPKTFQAITDSNEVLTRKGPGNTKDHGLVHDFFLKNDYITIYLKSHPFLAFHRFFLKLFVHVLVLFKFSH